MHRRIVLLILLASILFIRDATSQDSSQKCTCSPCGSPCTNPIPPPPQEENYPPPPPTTPEYYPPPPPPPSPSPPPPILPPSPAQPYCPPPPHHPSPPSPTTPSNPCCSPSSRSAPYFGLIPPGQLYPQDPTFLTSAAHQRLHDRFFLFVVFFFIVLRW